MKIENRGRKVGMIVNLRDARGWQIPTAGSKRRQIYELIIAGERRSEICERVGISIRSYKRHRRYIVAPDRMNELDRMYKSRLKIRDMEDFDYDSN